MSFLRGFLSTPTEEEKQQGGFEAIERLIERLQTSTLLDDRRDAIRALRALSKSFQVEVGTHAMDILINVIKEDSSDIEITEMVIETLLNVMTSAGENPPETDLGVQFTEMFVKTEDNVALLLSLLEEYEFHVRWPTVKLLSLLLKNRGKELQERVLESPMGISKLMDLLSDSREIIRNDGLLLMIKLTKNNASIQKIVAFENAFERLLNIVSVEGNSDGGIIVEDCLALLLNLLRNNLSNQNFFRETSNIQRITPFFEMPAAEEEEEEVPPVWNVQKQTNILLMLELLQVLISPTNNPQSVTSCQKVMYTRGIYMRLMDLLLYPGLPPDIFSKLLITIGDIIRGNEIIQQFMDELEMSERPAILLILMFMVNDKQPFKARLAALYCVQCFLFKNQKGQARVISTLLPNQEDVQVGVTSGQLLCAGLFSNDTVAHWLCSVTLAHCLYNNVAQHENMLQVQLELTSGLPPVHLINQVFRMLAEQDSNARTRFGTLMLLLHWVEECPGAVSTLLNNSAFIPYLLELVEHTGGEDSSASLLSSMGAMLLGLCLKYNDNSCLQYPKTTLLHLITHRVGKENYCELLDSASVNPLFTLATKSPHPTSASVEELFLDFSFTKFFKKQQDAVTRALEGEDETETENTIDSHDEIVAGYKNLILEQDEEITRLKSQLAQCSSVPAQTTQQSADHVTQIEQLHQYTRDQEQYYQQYIAQLQTWYSEQMEQLQSAQRAPSDTSPPQPETSSSQLVTSSQPVTSAQPDTSLEYEKVLAERNSLISSMEEMRRSQDQATEELRATVSDRDARLQEARLQKDEQDRYLTQILSELEQLKLSAQARSEQETDERLIASEALATANSMASDLRNQLSLLSEKLSQIENESLSLKEKLIESETLNSALQRQISETESEISVLRQKLSQSESQVVASESEASGLTGLLSERDSSFSLLQEKLSQSESDTSFLKVKLSETETEIARLREELVGKDEELSTLSAELRQSKEPSGSPSVEEAAVVPNTSTAPESEEIQSLRAQLEELRSLNSDLSEHKDKNENLKRQLASLQVELQELRAEKEAATAASKSEEETPPAVETSSETSEKEAATAASKSEEETSPAVDTSSEPAESTPHAKESPQVVSIVTASGVKRDYLYDYTQWFSQVESDDGVTYYLSTEGHYYTEEQYIYTMDQYEQYYRSQLPENNQTAEQAKEQTEEETVDQKSEQTAEQKSEQTAEQKSEETAKQTAEPTTEQTAQPTAVVDEEISDEPSAGTTQSQDNEVEGLKAEVAKLNLEVERLQSEVERLQCESERLQSESERLQTEAAQHSSEKPPAQILTVSETAHHDISCPERVLEKSQIKQIDISGGEDHVTCSPTPDMSSSSTDSELAQLQEKYENLASEQDDLLVLLAHQDKKLAQLKARLRTLGEEVKSSESEDDFDDLMDSCEDLPETDQLTGDGRLM